MGFQITFSNVLLTLLYLVPGYAICKARKATSDHLPTISVILVYICSPCMIISSFINLDYSPDKLLYMGLFFLVTLILQSVFMLLLYLIFKRKFSDNRYRILTIGSVLGNVGFFGLPVISALLPGNPEVLCYSSIYIISMNVLVFTAGVFCLTENKKFLSLRSAVINPSAAALVIALPLFITGAKLWMPELLTGAISLLGKMSTPLCMLMLGIRLGTVPFRVLLSRPFVYFTSVGKLLVFPLFCYAAVAFLPLPLSFKVSVLILSGTPCASVIQSLAEIHHSETELAANCLLLSTLLCLATIPVLTLVVS